MKTRLLAFAAFAAGTAATAPAPARAQMTVRAPVTARVPLTQRLIVPPPPPATPPPGISVQMQTSTQLGPQVGGPGTPPVSLGMASNFTLETTPPATAPHETSGNGAIQFATGNELAVWLDQAAARKADLSKLIITNVTPTATVVYTLRDALVTGTQAGAAISATIRYRAISWTYSANGQAPVTGDYDFSNNAK